MRRILMVAGLLAGLVAAPAMAADLKIAVADSQAALMASDDPPAA